MSKHQPRIFGLMVVRNEADILRVNLLHHFAAGIDHVLAVDNGSADGTPEVLDEFAREGRLEWKRDAGAYLQAALTTALAREAHGQGADWVLPIDADEFWYSPTGSLRDVLMRSKAGGRLVQVFNFIQRRDQIRSQPAALLHVTRRAPLPIGPLELIRDCVENRQHAFVEMMYQPKWISRASARIGIGIGNHHVSGVDGPLEATDEIVCLHVPVRSREALEGKVEHGARLDALGLDANQGWHVRRWLRLHGEGQLDAEWRANSYSGSTLDVFGTSHLVVFDPRLRDLVRPWIVADGFEADPHNTHAELDELKVTLHHQLQVSLARDMDLRRQLQREVSRRDERIVALQEEVFTKITASEEIISGLHVKLQARVESDDDIIRDLQAQLERNVSESNEIIRGLQAELESKVAESSGIIHGLQAELHARVAEANEIICGLQEEMRTKVEEANEVIRSLQAGRDNGIAASEQTP